MIPFFPSAEIVQTRPEVVRATPAFVFPVGRRGLYTGKATAFLGKDEAVVCRFVVTDPKGRVVARLEDGWDPVEAFNLLPAVGRDASLLFVRRNGNHTFGNVYLVSPKGIRSIWHTSAPGTIEARKLNGRWRILVVRYAHQIGGPKLEEQWGPMALDVYDIVGASVRYRGPWRIAGQK